MSRRERPIHVLVVDDSAVVREAFAVILRRRPEMSVTVAFDAIAASRSLARAKPDVIVLDLEMPHMDGLTFLEQLMAENPIPVVICSGLAAPHTEMAIRALELGAVAVVPKPALGIQEFLHREAAELVRTIQQAADVRVRRRSSVRFSAPRITPPSPTSDPFLPRVAPGGAPLRIVAIGASTGGVEAIRTVLAPLPPDAPPLLIVQHMPPGFTSAFARGLGRTCRIEIKEAQDGDIIRPGRALIAPGDWHMSVVRQANGLAVKLSDGPRVSGHRPSVDVLFRSLAETSGVEAVGVLLTGMGSDGAEGMRSLRQAGATTIAQDEASSVVWGMPKAAIDQGAAGMVLPIDRIPGALLAKAEVSAAGSPR